jgi:hypothetical protein
MRSVSEINEQFRYIAEKHLILNSFHTNSLEEMDVNKWDMSEFPLLYAQVTGAAVEEGVTTFNYEVIVATVTIEAQLPTLDDSYTETFLILQDVIAVLENTIGSPITGVGNLTLGDPVYGLEMPVQCTPFAQRFDNLLTGWSTQMSIRVPNPLELCNIPV